jgi:hypothetical protein
MLQLARVTHQLVSDLCDVCHSCQWSAHDDGETTMLRSDMTWGLLLHRSQQLTAHPVNGIQYPLFSLRSFCWRIRHWATQVRHSFTVDSNDDTWSKCKWAGPVAQAEKLPLKYLTESRQSTDFRKPPVPQPHRNTSPQSVPWNQEMREDSFLLIPQEKVQFQVRCNLSSASVKWREITWSKFYVSPVKLKDYVDICESGRVLHSPPPPTTTLSAAAA